MRLYVEKSKVMHFGKSNPRAAYIMMDHVDNKRDIEQSNLERDLGRAVATI